MAPTFLENFNLAVDYYDIAIVDAISQISNENIMRECTTQKQHGAKTTYFVMTLPVTAKVILLKSSTSYNLDELTARGYDVVAQYKLDLDNLGQLSFKLDYNHVIENSKLMKALMAAW